MSIFSQPAPTDYGRGKQWFLVNSEQLEALVIQFSPEIRHDTNRMADMIKELVELERTKAGFDSPSGTLTLSPNKNKKGPNSPDMIGTGLVTGRNYRAAAWFSGDESIKISLLPPR